jgi:hypothetical protein
MAYKGKQTVICGEKSKKGYTSYEGSFSAGGMDYRISINCGEGRSPKIYEGKQSGKGLIYVQVAAFDRTNSGPFERRERGGSKKEWK